ncbi:hypothetical protein [Algoriphagus sp. Y33]|uniref:hypothetical protein n=1 Tax=Algoriphagus sp. Y33 TaxID=2772483 RepID=UPI00177BC060|nr:hypothetical protein [Algoriphagus sp. Y33]
MKNLFWYPIISANNWLFLLCLVLSLQTYGQESKVWYFFSLDERTPLAYLRLLPTDGKQAFFTDLEGKLALTTSDIPQISSFNISGYGINDTLISIQQLMSLDTVFLKAKEFELPEVAINSRQLSELKIGDSSAEGWEVSKPMGLINGPEGEFYRYTIRVKIPKKNQLLLDKIKFYVSNILAEKVDVSLRVLYPNSGKRIVPGKINSIAEFTELLQENKIITVSNSGWQQVRFQEPMQIPRGVGDLFIVFDLLEKEPKSRFAIVDQKNTKDIDLGFYITGGQIGVNNLDPIHPAVELTFLKD